MVAQCNTENLESQSLGRARSSRTSMAGRSRPTAADCCCAKWPRRPAYCGNSPSASPIIAPRIWPSIRCWNSSRQLEPPAAGDRQGRASRQGAEPAVRGHVAVRRRVRCPRSLRRFVLRPGRHREPHQGAAVAFVRRPHQLRHDAGLSTAAVLLVGGLRADDALEAVRLEGHGTAGRG